MDNSVFSELDSLCRNGHLKKNITDEKWKDMSHSHDVRPSELAPVIAAAGGEPVISSIMWGIPSPNAGMLINARAESVFERKMFRRGIMHHRIAVPAAGFYEWNHLREKNKFRRGDRDILYLAGLMDHVDNENRFVIITTFANESVRPVHDRMPLILDGDQIGDWIFNDGAVVGMLNQEPATLERQAEYEQLTLF